MHAQRFFSALILIGSFSLATAVHADTLTMPESSQSEHLPVRGATMDKVMEEFGTPNRKIGPVGEPPITRWIYNDFTVYFENNRVIHPVIRTSHTGWPLN